MDPVVKVDHCAQYVDDIGSAANNATDLSRNIRAVFKFIFQEELELKIEKCHFGVRKVEFIGGIISLEVISPEAWKTKNLHSSLRFTKSEEALQRYLGFATFDKNRIPGMAEEPSLFFKQLKTWTPT